MVCYFLNIIHISIPMLLVIINYHSLLRNLAQIKVFKLSSNSIFCSTNPVYHKILPDDFCTPPPIHLTIAFHPPI